MTHPFQTASDVRKQATAEAKPRFDTKKFLEDNVRRADQTTREVMFMAHAGKANPKKLRELADAYNHCANSLLFVADGLKAKVEFEKEG